MHTTCLLKFIVSWKSWKLIILFNTVSLLISGPLESWCPSCSPSCMWCNHKNLQRIWRAASGKNLVIKTVITHGYFTKMEYSGKLLSLETESRVKSSSSLSSDYHHHVTIVIATTTIILVIIVPWWTCKGLWLITGTFRSKNEYKYNVLLFVILRML